MHACVLACCWQLYISTLKRAVVLISQPSSQFHSIQKGTLLRFVRLNLRKRTAGGTWRVFQKKKRWTFMGIKTQIVFFLDVSLCDNCFRCYPSCSNSSSVMLFFCLFFQLLLWKYQDKWVIWPDYCWKTSRQICQSSLTADGKNQSEWKGGDWDNEYYIETNSVKQTTSRQQQNIGEWEWSDLRLFWHAFSRHSKQPEAS